MILVAFWAKAEPVDGGLAEGVVSAVRVQQAEAPYEAAVQGSNVKVAGDWKMYTVPGRATIDIAAGAANVALHLGSAKQTPGAGTGVRSGLWPGLRPEQAGPVGLSPRARIASTKLAR